MPTLRVYVTIRVIFDSCDLELPHTPLERGTAIFEVRGAAGQGPVLRHRHHSPVYLAALWAAHVVEQTSCLITWTDPGRVIITDTSTGEAVEAEVETDLLP